jgi:hypothetical protein
MQIRNQGELLVANLGSPVPLEEEAAESYQKLKKPAHYIVGLSSLLSNPSTEPDIMYGTILSLPSFPFLHVLGFAFEMFR